MNNFVSAKKASEQLGFSIVHLRRMAKNDKIRTYRTDGGRTGMMSRTTLQNGQGNQLGQQSATAVSAANRNQMSLNPKLSICEKISLKPKSSKTKAAVSTSKEKGLEPYWNASCEAISSALLLPIGTDSPASAEKSFNSWSSKTVEKSWFSTKLFTAPQKNLLPISSQFCVSFPATCMDSGDTVIKSKKIEIFPTLEQKTILSKWFGTSRYTFNEALRLLDDKDTSTNFKGLVPVVFDKLPEWHEETPRQIKVGAVMDACQAIRNAKVKCKNTGEFQKVKFRSRKHKQTLYLRADSLKANGFYVRLLGDMKMAEPLPAKPQGKGKVSERDTDAEVKDSQLVLENGRYFLCVPYVEKKKTREPSGRIVALDPGVRDFMTFFSEDSFGWLGHQCINRIQRLCQHCDNLLSRATQEKRPLRRALRKAANRIKVKIRNLVDELHKKVAHFLVTHFDIILLPTFESKQMTKRGHRKLRRKSVRQMLTLSHYRFKDFLKQKALEYSVQVIDVCEAWTSKTVSWTGEIITNLGGSKVIKSSEGHRMDRDLNGARGIFIKNVARALKVSPST